MERSEIGQVPFFRKLDVILRCAVLRASKDEPPAPVVHPSRLHLAMRTHRKARTSDDAVVCGDSVYFASSQIIPAPFSAIIAVGVLVLPEVMVGMIEASTIRRPERP